MMVEALENNEDIIESDKTLHVSPYGRQDYYNSLPVMRNYINPKEGQKEQDEKGQRHYGLIHARYIQTKVCITKVYNKCKGLL